MIVRCLVQSTKKRKHQVTKPKTKVSSKNFIKILPPNQNLKNTANMKDIASSTMKTPLKGILKSPAVSPSSSPKNSSGVHFGAPMNLEETLKAAAENNLRSEELGKDKI